MTKEDLYGDTFSLEAEPFIHLLFGYPPKLDVSVAEVRKPHVCILNNKASYSGNHIFLSQTGRDLYPLEDFLKLLLSERIVNKYLNDLDGLMKINREMFYRAIYQLYYTGKSDQVGNEINVWLFYKEFFGGSSPGAIIKFVEASSDAYCNSICLAFIRALMKVKKGIFDKSIAYKKLLIQFDMSHPHFMRIVCRNTWVLSELKKENKAYLFWIHAILAK